MCELLNRAQILAKKIGSPIPVCSPNIQAICNGTECALQQIVGGESHVLCSKENLDKFYNRLEAHRKLVASSSPKN